jgi:hypothetical protein
MENEIKLKIYDFYKNVDKSVINNLTKDENIQDILKLSVYAELNLLNKTNDKWKLKDKRTLLKEIDLEKKNKIKQLTNLLENSLDNTLENIKITNEKIINDINNINNLKRTIEKDDVYNNIKNITKKNYTNKVNKRIIKNEDNMLLTKFINKKPKNINNYIEIYSN